MPEVPDFSRLVFAKLEGVTEHSGTTWHREGYAFMAYHRGTDPAKDGWSDRHMRDALKAIDADSAKIVMWAYPEDVNWKDAP